ncbi:uncharacterized protein LOC126901548 isoform X2 [Daktulosphaira vitifoliae]|uniref:uncharacterized protein LOC126901548 isoform X2 n=1 Tax=Daktulosphaira vitifoliae TaxID=58002 RepID=UPI0021AA07D2|nr:uncharacterized protein LOC126901548 isoform X2 [Daktulosphaira vitifoliae]
MSFSKNSIIILVFFTNYLLLSIHCNRELFPNGVQLGYRWKAITHVGTVLPSEHITKYSFDAYFVVQSNQNYTTFQIKEFQTTEKQQYFPWIAWPFRCTYKDGEIQKIETEYDDVSGSLNIKRALAALFQLKLESLSQAAFTTQETGIFGKCSAQYIINKDNNKTNVEKIINFSACNGKLGQQWSNTPPFTCPSNYQDGSISHSIRHYSLDDKDIINRINVIGTIEFQPFQALAEAHRIFVNQSIFLEGISSSTDITTLVNKLEVTIEYDFNHYEDPTLGFKPSNKTQLLSEIHGALEQLTESLSWELGTSDLDNQTSFRALELMWWLDVPDWNMLYDTIKIGTSYSQETVQHIFWDLLPQVGSASSVEFIRELVKTQKATSFLATGLLMMFPYNVRYPNEKLLQESEMLLNLDKVIRDAEIMKVAILSFSTLIQKTCSNNMCSTDIQNKYIKLFLDRFHESSNYGDQMMYIEALNNMKINNILDFLTPIINDNNRSRHIRLIAIWASKYTVTIHPEKVAEVFWPIFTNHSEPLEIRASSLDMLMMSQPSISRFLTLFWFMQSEPNQNMYNYYYTTINSLVNSKYPCYSKYKAISQIARFVRQKWHNWATGNYILDYEDLVRGYGGIVQTILIANKHTGFPSVLRITAEQHSFGTSSEFEIHIKAEGFTTNIKKEIFNSFVNPSFEVVNVSKILEVLENAKLKIRNDEELHFEAIIKFNQQTIFCHYMNRTSFNSFFNTMKRISSLYFQFSFNYQRLSFPLRFQRTMFTDYGTPVLLQFRTASLLSLRGSIKQAESGKSRDAELDFRYSMDTVTSLKTFNPLSNIWHGADRFRCIHARIPFSTEIVTQFFRSYVKASAHRYKNFVDGSKLGVVWHSATKLFPMKESLTQNSKNELLSDDWAFESRDLGAKIATAVFDCQDNGTFSNSLMIIKEAFQISNKNYRSIPGGAAFLSIYSLSNYFTFIPPEDSCGLILSISPLQVVPVYVQEGNTVHITMNHYEQVLWDLSIHYTRLADGNQELSFKLSHSNRERDITITNGYWRLLQFEGSFVLPSRKSGALHPPPPMHGQATVSWGYHSSATTMTLAIKPEHAHEKWPEQCIADSPTCLQIASDISTSQIISLKFLNLPNWMIITMHSLFPDFVHDEGNLTTAKFTFPTKLPWTTRGICAVNTKTVLTLDNSTTHNFDLNQDCYTIALGDCSNATRFVIGIKINPITSLLDIHLISQNTIISMIHDGSKVRVHVNEIEIEVTETTIQFPPKSKNDSFIYRVKRWDKEMTDLEIHPGVTIQHYGQTVLMLVESKLRGHTCGLCGNFNGESSDEIYNLTTNCVRF